MADFDGISSLESPKKRLRLEGEETNSIFTCPVGRETTHLPTSSEINCLHPAEDQLLEGKHSLNFDPGSGAGFEHDPSSSEAANLDDSVPTHFDNDFLSEQSDSREQDHCLPCPASSSSPTTSEANASVDHEVSDADNDEENSSGSDEGSIESLDEDDLDLGLGECELEQPVGPMQWLQRQMMSGVHPRSILARLLPRASSSLPEDLDEFEVWSIIADYFQMLREPPRRKKLPDFNTFDDALNLLRSSKRIMVLTGAGVSVSCGIPDFRSRDGVYARLAVDFPDLPDPQAIFDIHYFRRNPRPFFKFAKEIYPGEFRPSPCHKFISLLEQHGKLLRNFSQNIDTLEQVAGITKVLQCHGSFATAHCTNCNYQVDCDTIRPDIFNQVVPLCPRCPPDPDVLAVMKPDIVFFGEGLPKDFYHRLDEDKDQADLLIVIGSSLKVQPVATIPNALPGNIPQILINREPLNHMTFDIELLGDGDVIVNEICRRLGEGWDHICQGESLVETSEMPDIPKPSESDSNDGDSSPAPDDLEQGIEAADSTSWVHESQHSPSGRHEPVINHGDDSQQASNSDLPKVEDEAFVTSEAALAVPGSDSSNSAKTGESNNMGITDEEFVEGKLPSSSGNLGGTLSPTAIDKTKETCHSDSSSHKEVPAQLQPANGPHGQDTEPLQDHPDRPKGQKTNGTQNWDISSTIREDDIERIDKANPASALTDVTASPVEQESCPQMEPETATSTPSNEAEFVGDSIRDGCPSGEETLNNKERAEAGTNQVLKTQDEASIGPRPKRKRRNSIALYLNSSSYLFVPPNRYIFHGAEVFPPSRPESPKTARLDTDTDQDDIFIHHDDHHDDDEASHHAESTDGGGASPGGVLDKEVRLEPETSAVPSGWNSSHAALTPSDSIRNDRQAVGSSALSDTPLDDDTNTRTSLSVTENAALHSGKAMLPCSVDFR